LGGAATSPRSRDHLGGSARAIPRLRSRAAPEADASSLRDDGRSGPLNGDRDQTVPPVAARGPAPCGAGNREVDLLVAAVLVDPHAPQRGDKKNCELLSSRCFSCAFGCDVDLLRGLLLLLTFCLLVVAVEVYPPCSSQGASPGGGDFQPE
jgi:hypothetical protein